MAEFGQNGCRGFRSPSGQARVAVGGVAHQRQIVGDGRRGNAEFLDDSVLIHRHAGPAIPLHHACALHALCQILIGRAEQHSFDPRIRGGFRCSSPQRVISLEFDHRPDGEARHGKHFLEKAELRQQIGLDAVAGLVSRPEAVPERLDDVVGGDRHVRRARLHQIENRSEHAAHRSYLPPLSIPGVRQRVVVAEQLVCAIDEVNLERSPHAAAALFTPAQGFSPAQ